MCAQQVKPRVTTAASTLVRSLIAHGVDRVFCVPGESYLPMLDVVYDVTGIDVVTCRHEGSAAFAALADAKLAGRAGVCLVSRDPGAANAASAVHAAAEDASPLIMFVGGGASTDIDREVFQNIDCGRQFGNVAKAVLTLHDPAAAGELIGRAFRIAEAGTPGAVVLMLPEDILGSPDTVAVTARRITLARTELCGEHLERVQMLLANARRPLLLAGSRVNTPTGRQLLREVSERHRIPVVTSNKNQHLMPNRELGYAGHLHNATQPSQLSALDAADLVLAVGTRLDSVTTKGRRFPAAPEPHQALVHVYPDAQQIGRYHLPTVGVSADPVDFLGQVRSWEPSGSVETRVGWLAESHEIEAAKAVWHPVEADDGVVFGAVVSTLDEMTDGQVTAVVDSGTFTSWVYRYLRFGDRGRLLGISSSAMGFGVGGGLSASLRSDQVPTVVFIGDGGYLMNSGDLATACHRQTPVVFIISNNGSYGTIRLHQELVFPGRTIGTDLANPDFARMAEAFGALGLTVNVPEQIRPCLAKALGNSGPSVIDVRTSLRHITAYRQLSSAPSSAEGAAARVDGDAQKG
jgi:acetolactate synthase I/II/III large subunit